MKQKQIRTYYLEPSTIALLEEMSRQLDLPLSGVIEKCIHSFAQHQFSKELGAISEGTLLLQKIKRR